MFPHRGLLLGVTISLASAVFADVLVQPGYEHHGSNPQYLQYQPIPQYQIQSLAEQYRAAQIPNKESTSYSYLSGAQTTYPRESQDNTLARSVLSYPPFFRYPYYTRHHPHYLRIGGRKYVRPSVYVGYPSQHSVAHNRFRRSLGSDPTSTESGKPDIVAHDNDVATKSPLIDAENSTADSLLPEHEPTDSKDKHVENRQVKNNYMMPHLFGLHPENMYPTRLSENINQVQYTPQLPHQIDGNRLRPFKHAESCCSNNENSHYVHSNSPSFRLEEKEPTEEDYSPDYSFKTESRQASTSSKANFVQLMDLLRNTPPDGIVVEDSVPKYQMDMMGRAAHQEPEKTNFNTEYRQAPSAPRYEIYTMGRAADQEAENKNFYSECPQASSLSSNDDNPGFFALLVQTILAQNARKVLDRISLDDADVKDSVPQYQTYTGQVARQEPETENFNTESRQASSSKRKNKSDAVKQFLPRILTESFIAKQYLDDIAESTNIGDLLPQYHIVGRPTNTDYYLESKILDNMRRDFEATLLDANKDSADIKSSIPKYQIYTMSQPAHQEYKNFNTEYRQASSTSLDDDNPYFVIRLLQQIYESQQPSSIEDPTNESHAIKRFLQRMGAEDFIEKQYLDDTAVGTNIEDSIPEYQIYTMSRAADQESEVKNLQTIVGSMTIPTIRGPITIPISMPQTDGPMFILPNPGSNENFNNDPRQRTSNLQLTDDINPPVKISDYVLYQNTNAQGNPQLNK